jgi:hypothetical protein
MIFPTAGSSLRGWGDGHGAGMLIGAAIASLLPAKTFVFVNGPQE